MAAPLERGYTNNASNVSVSGFAQEFVTFHSGNPSSSLPPLSDGGTRSSLPPEHVRYVFGTFLEENPPKSITHLSLFDIFHSSK